MEGERFLRLAVSSKIPKRVCGVNASGDPENGFTAKLLRRLRKSAPTSGPAREQSRETAGTPHNDRHPRCHLSLLNADYARPCHTVKRIRHMTNSRHGSSRASTCFWVKSAKTACAMRKRATRPSMVSGVDIKYLGKRNETYGLRTQREKSASLCGNQRSATEPARRTGMYAERRIHKIYKNRLKSGQHPPCGQRKPIGRRTARCGIFIPAPIRSKDTPGYGPPFWPGTELCRPVPSVPRRLWRRRPHAGPDRCSP